MEGLQKCSKNKLFEVLHDSEINKKYMKAIITMIYNNSLIVVKMGNQISIRWENYLTHFFQNTCSKSTQYVYEKLPKNGKTS